MKKINFLISSMICSLAMLGQTIYKDYIDGEIYIKYTVGGQKKIGNVINPKNIPVQQMYGIAELSGRYNISKVEKPFWIADDDADLQRIYKVHFNNIAQIDAFINELNEKNFIEYAEKVPLMKTFVTPNDPSYSSQWHLPKINAPNAWNVFSGNSNITVAIVDNAVQITHPDLSPNVWVNPNEIPNNNIDDDMNGYVDDINGWDVGDDDNNPNPPNTTFDHGTHCAGDAAARTNNSTGIAAIGWNLKIIAVKCTPDNGSSSSIYNGYGGMLYASRVKAKVISCSWGGTSSAASEQAVINYVWNRGSIIVCAAANDGNSTPHYPAAYNNVFSVASTGSTDVKSSFSCYGSWVDICAPGENIYSTVPSSTYGYMSGTSMATPIVAGLCGLVWSKNPAMTQQAVLNCITTTAANIYTITGNASYSGQLGAGRIDAYQALLCAQSSTNNPPVAQFTSNRQIICPGQSIQFYDASYFSPTSWSWVFQGGTPATATSSNPIVIWNTPGTYSVQLTASNANGSSTATQTAYVIVSNTINLPFSEGFQGTSFPPAGWYADDKFQDGTTWAQNTSVGSFGASTKSAYFDNYDMDARGIPVGLYTPKLNFSSVSSATLQFDVAYARYDATYSDSLEVKVSTNCGTSWTSIYLKGGTTLSTAPDYTAAMFSPTSSQWRTESVIITSQTAGQGNVMFSFVNRGHYGQAIYLDNINIQYVAASPPVTAFNAPSNNCSGTAITFTDATTNSPTSWSWLMPGATPSVSSVQNPTVTYYTGGVYTVTLTASNSNGSNSAVQTLTVKTTPTVSVNSATICSGQTATLAATGGTTYLWSTGAVSSSITVSPSNTSTYSVTGKNGLCQDVKTTTVTVNPNPTITVNSASICTGQSANIFASGASSYTWSTGANTSSISVSPIATSYYTVTGVNAFNCKASQVSTITVNANPSVNVSANNATSPGCANGSATLNVTGNAPFTYNWNPNVSSTNSASNLNGTSGGINYTVTVTDANNCQSSITFSVDCVTGINQNNSAFSNVEIYPNPNNGSFIIQSHQELRYALYNSLGQLILESNISEGKNLVDIHNMSTGLYNLILLDKFNNRMNFRIAVQ